MCEVGQVGNVMCEVGQVGKVIYKVGQMGNVMCVAVHGSQYLSVSYQ